MKYKTVNDFSERKPISFGSQVSLYRCATVISIVKIMQFIMDVK